MDKERDTIFEPASGDRRELLEQSCQILLEKEDKFDRESFKRFVMQMITLLGGSEYLTRGWRHSRYFTDKENTVTFELSYNFPNRAASISLWPAWMALPPDQKQEVVDSLTEPIFNEYVAYPKDEETGQDLSPYVYRSVGFPEGLTPFKPFISYVTGAEKPVFVQFLEGDKHLNLAPIHVQRLCQRIFSAYQQSQQSEQ